MHTEIANRKEEIADICRRYRVTRLEVFGSAARGTDFDPEEFLVEFEPPTMPAIFKRHMGLVQDLSDTLGRKVDVIRMGKTCNRTRNKFLQEAINESRELVYKA